ncbi:cytosine/purines uracil thiamine allantoin permease [Mycolicibacterium aurum]|uniref:Cytosine/purines uracil thiamine allantoin permease n=1 Tax=Mycolicibacterium aurum TaxID=1791 RepID=A0A448IUD0_MYCAU|nr:cytosine permease [Mycolicibacterium aurum]VEG55917.1 cytosine/purines uracil thiamine allantoin permease [Mycolicibacterium aurum]
MSQGTSAESGTSALTGDVFSGRRPAGAGDLSVETHGIAPIAEEHRYGAPSRLFTVWFAPQVNMTGVFTGTLAIVLGLGFWLGLLAMVIGTVLGSLVVGYLSTWGPRTGAGQLPNARMAFGGTVVVPAALQWFSSIAWDALVGLFGGEALSALLGIPFWSAVLIVLGVQGVVGFFGYELIHRLQAVLTVVLFVTFVAFTVKLVGGHEIVVPAAVSGADLVGAFVLEVTIAFSLAISWATYAADFSRYLPSSVSPVRVFGFTAAGLAAGYVFVQGVGIAAASVVGEHTVEGVRSVMGGGVLGALALLVIAIASIGSGVMNDYSGSLALQTIGVRVRRPVSAVIVTVLAFVLILWLHAADTATRFTDVLLLVSYWIPAFVAVVVIDWRVRAAGRRSVDPARETTGRRDGMAALVVFVVAYLVAIPFMNTSLIQGPVALAWHGADIAYFVNGLAAAALYGGYRRLTARRVAAAPQAP